MKKSPMIQYDGVAVSPSGHNIGIEVKSGSAQKTSAQRNFDNRIGKDNPAIGIGQHNDLEISHTITIRR